MSVLSPGRRFLPAVVALVALLALAGEAPGSTTQAPSSTDAALAIERYYSSYGEAPPVADGEVPPVADGEAGATRDGISTAPFLLGLTGALVIGLAVGSLSPLAIARRRARIGEVS